MISTLPEKDIFRVARKTIGNLVPTLQKRCLQGAFCIAAKNRRRTILSTRLQYASRQLQLLFPDV